MKVALEIANPFLAAVGKATPIDQLCWLVFHEDKHIRLKVADNPRLPLACLMDLAIDEAHEVRISVAENSRTPVAILEVLAEDNHPDVRYAMAENAHTPEHILHFLLNDENPYVAARASVTLKRLEGQAPALLRCCA